MAPCSPLPDGYRDLRDHVAWADAGRRSTVLVSGEDAVRFVDGFCTAALSTLAPGEGTEAFFPDARGQVLLLATVFRGPDGVWIDADPAVPVTVEGAGGEWSLAAHLERYHIRERLEISDQSDHFAALFLAGPAAGAWIERGAAATLPAEAIPAVDAVAGPLLPIRLARPFGRMADVAAGNLPAVCGGVLAAVLRGEWLGPGTCLVVVARDDRERLVARWQGDGIVEASAGAIDAVRREEGRLSAVDVPPRALPQELVRDDRAISFTKGCYLGQETVARIDALGHVNRRFVGIVAAADVLAGPGATVTIRGSGEAVGTITSSGPSPLFDGWLGLGLVRTSALAAGIELEIAGIAARWVELPPRCGGKGAVS